MSSIRNQVLANSGQGIQIVIVRDSNCKDYWFEDIDCHGLNCYSLEIYEHVGPGIARQVALDNTDSEYVMFLDADDMLYSVDTLYQIFNLIDQYPDLDIIMADMVTEFREDKKLLTLQVKDNAVLAAKIFKREFLKRNDIRFPEELKVNEDAYYVSLCFNLTDKICHFPVTTYVYVDNPDSLTRKNNGEFWKKEISSFITAKYLACKDLIKRTRYDKAKILAIDTICQLYFKDRELELPEEQFDYFFNVLMKTREEEFIAIYNKVYQETLPAAIPQETIFDWIKRRFFHE